MKITSKNRPLILLIFITFIVLGVGSNAFAKNGINVQAETLRLAEYRFHTMAKKQDKYICELSMIYEVPYTNIVSILSKQYFYYGFEDSMQDLFIGSGRYFNDKDERRLKKEYKIHKKLDRLNFSNGVKNKSRNSTDSYLFSSLGPAQIQIYMAMKLIDIYPNLDYADINSIANALSSKEGSIEFLTAELKYAIDAYKKIAKIDISHNTQALWQLHNGGSVEYRAKDRYQRSKTKDPMPNINGIRSNHPEIEKYFESTGYECFN